MSEITSRLSTALAERYKLERHLGEGGMATVFLAADLKHDRKVALLDWRKKQQSRAAVRLTIEEQLDQLPEKFAAEVYQQKCDLVYQHVYESYYGGGRSVYETAA